MLTTQNLYDDIYNKTGLTTADVSTSVLLTYLNQRQNDLHQIITEVNEDFTGTTTTTSMTSGIGSFAIPSSTIKVKRIEVSYDNSGIFVEADPVELNAITSGTDATTIKNNFTTSDPAYEIFGSTVNLYPPATANVTNGFKMWRIPHPTALAATTDTPSVALEGFEHLLSAGVVADVAIAYGLQTLAAEYKERWMTGTKDMRRQLQNRSLEENLSLTALNENRE